HAGLGALQQLRVGDHLLKLISLQAILLNALNGLPGKQPMHPVDPFRDRKLGVTQAAASFAGAPDIASFGVFAVIKKTQGLVPLAPFSIQTLAERRLATPSEYEPPTA